MRLLLALLSPPVSPTLVQQDVCAKRLHHVVHTLQVVPVGSLGGERRGGHGEVMSCFSGWMGSSLSEI